MNNYFEKEKLLLEKRKYVKRDLDYWYRRIKQRKKRPKSKQTKSKKDYFDTILKFERESSKLIRKWAKSSDFFKSSKEQKKDRESSGVSQTLSGLLDTMKVLKK